jgi:potassium uptake TrkH family protein
MTSTDQRPRRLRDAVRRRVLRRRRSAHTNPLRRPAQYVSLGFVGLLGTGTALLMLPVSVAGPGGAGFRRALFTATSAGCVTGLTVVDTATYWTPFGQCVLLALMQLGGLGVMTFASLLGLLVAGRLGLRSRLLAQSETRTLDLGTVSRVIGAIVRVSLLVEGIVMVALFLRWKVGYDESVAQAAWHAVFHAVSAYNNAGFGLWTANLIPFAGDPYILVPIGAALAIGGIGYPVMFEVARSLRSPSRGSASRWSLHTKLTLVTTAVLLVLGPLIIILTERNNPGTLGSLPWWDKFWSGWFSGVTPRTAGFNSIDYGQAEPATLLTTDFLMLVGGGSAGTAGGIKVTTLAVLVMAVVTEVRGDPDVDVFGRRVDFSTIRQAMSVALMASLVVVVATFVLEEITPNDLDHVLFEVVSAFATVGLSTGITANLPPAAEYVLIALMFLGRVGPITVASALALRPSQRAYRNPEARPMVG